MNTEQLIEKVSKRFPQADKKAESHQVKLIFFEMGRFVSARDHGAQLLAIGLMAIHMCCANHFAKSVVWRCPIFDKSLGLIANLVGSGEYRQALNALQAYVERDGFVWEQCLDEGWRTWSGDV